MQFQIVKLFYIILKNYVDINLVLLVLNELSKKIFQNKLLVLKIVHTIFMKI